MREVWESHRLSELADMCLGKMLDQRKNKGEPYPYLANVNVQWGKINLDDLRNMRFESTEFDRYGLNKGDIVMCEGGEPGRCAIWKGQKKNMMIQKALHRIRAKSHVDSCFLYYSLLYYGLRGYFTGYFTGSAIKHLTGISLAKINIDLPSLPTQRKITSILSAYDDLIENNLKRIKLLEEKAQLTYEEWFVKMRFPGYETAMFDEVTGLPAGWEKVKVESLLGKVKSTTKIKSSEILIDGIIPVIDQSRDFVAGYTNDESSLVDIVRPLIVFGDHTRILKFVNFNFARGADGTQLVLSNNDRMPQHLFYHALMNIDLSNYHYARHFKFLKDSEIILSDLNTANQYEKITKPVFDSINVLRNQNRFLKEARDILLPRFMSGMVDVEELRIRTLQTTE